jgi:hypothetical protein
VKKTFPRKKNNNGDHGESLKGTMETMNVTATACMPLCS